MDKLSLLTEVNKNNKQFEEKMNEVVKKNSQVATNAIPQTSDNTDLHVIIREEQNEQLDEETDKKMLSCNLMLKVSVLMYSYFNETMQLY